MCVAGVTSHDRARLKYLYGVTPEWVEEQKRKQGFACAVCRVGKPTCVDHCHETGKVRGILCRKCNMALGLLGESATVCRLASEYLEK